MSSLRFNDVLSAIAHIKGGLPAVRISSRIKLGEHRSLFFGQGDFFDIKEFDPDVDLPNMKVDLEGDEDTEYARRCIEMHEVRLQFVVDLSPSIYTGLDLNRQKTLLETMGFIGATAVRYMDPVGLIGFTDKVVLNMPARAGMNNFYYLLKNVYDFLERHDLAGKRVSRVGTNFFAPLDFIRRYFNKPCFIPIISDFVGFEKVIDSPLLRHIAARHELIFIFLDDPLEFLSAKGRGYLSMCDPESGKATLVSRRKLLELEQYLRYQRSKLRKEKLGKTNSVVLEYGKQGRHLNRLHRFFLKRHKMMSVRH